jgi:short subunit fatty acids transporter
MNLRRWLTNPIVIAALVEFVIIVAIVVLVLTRN